MGGKEYTNCTKDNINLSDLSTPCVMFYKERMYQKKINKKRANKKDPSSFDLNELVRKINAPVKIYFKVISKKKQ